MSIYHSLLVLHLVSMAVWFGNSLSVPGRVRRGLSLGDAEAKWMVDEVARTLRLSFVFGILTLVTGLVLIFYKGGFGTVSKHIHMGLGLTIILLAIEFLTKQTAWARIQRTVREGGDRSCVACAKKQMMASSGIRQLLWLVILILMVMQRSADFGL